MNTAKIIDAIKSYPIVTASALLSIIILLLIFFTSGSLPELETQFTDTEYKAEQVEKNNVNSIGLKQNLSELEHIDVDIRSRLMQEGELADHYRYFLGLAEANEVRISDPKMTQYMSPKDKKTKINTKQFAQVQYAIQIFGEFKKVVAFLYDLRTGWYFTRIIDMEIQTTGEINENAVVMLLTIRVVTAQDKDKNN